MTKYTMACLLAGLTWAGFAVNHARGEDQTVKARHTFEIGEQAFLLDGKPFVIRCGEIHFARVPREYWRHRLKMCKAMGLNTVCVYLFWNFHEWEEGKFDWTGRADVVEFCKIAQEEGLWVLLRPGPYSCAEWEMGGLPWWLLKNDGIKLRTKDPKFMEPSVRYLKEVARVLGPMQITKGGPLLMAQVENEYGYYGNDAEYMGLLRQALIDGGFDVPLFACNPGHTIGNGYRTDLFQVVNFGGGGAKGSFELLRKYQKTGPLMNGEYYPGWFDTWGKGHRTGAADQIAWDLAYMLDAGCSFSIYMAHGGTSFELWAGANEPFDPDTSSYDYDAPISEAGWVTDKFLKIREVFARYLQPGETLPEPPAKNPVIEIPEFSLSETASAADNLPEPRKSKKPLNMEAYDQGRGCILYRTTLPSGDAEVLRVAAAHDFAKVFLDGKKIGEFDRRGKRYRLQLPERKKPAQLDIFVEAMGRVNFGGGVHDRKGLRAPVELVAKDGKATELENWEAYGFPLDNRQLAKLKYGPAADGDMSPKFWRGSFDLREVGDTFLDMQNWGKGVVWVNGYCLGRFWNIGPTQTMYCPAPWLTKGKNEVVVFDLSGPEKATLAGLDKPILNLLRPEKDVAQKVRAKGTFTAAGLSLTMSGNFSDEVKWQTVKFPKPAQGRYLCLEMLNSINGKPFAAVAELDALNGSGEVMNRDKWKILWVSSEEVASESGEADNMIDGQPNSHWHSGYGARETKYPHRVVIDLGEDATVTGIRYLPRGGGKQENGRVKDFNVYVSPESFGLEPAE